MKPKHCLLIVATLASLALCSIAPPASAAPPEGPPTVSAVPVAIVPRVEAPSFTAPHFVSRSADVFEIGHLLFVAPRPAFRVTRPELRELPLHTVWSTLLPAWLHPPLFPLQI